MYDLLKESSKGNYKYLDWTVTIWCIDTCMVQRSTTTLIYSIQLTFCVCLWWHKTGKILSCKDKVDQYQYLGNCPPTPPLTQQQSIDNKLGLMLG